jgi:hypothetical protein
MGLLTIDWFDPAPVGGEPPGSRDAAVWLFGIVIDARSVASRRFVRRADHARHRRIEAVVEPIAGVATAGVVAVLCDWAGCGGAGEAAAYGSVAAAALDRLVDQRLPSSNPRDLQLWLEQDIADTVRRGWSGLGPLADRYVATAHRLLTLDGPVDERLDLRFATPWGDHRMTGTLRHSSVVDVTDPVPSVADQQNAGSNR